MCVCVILVRVNNKSHSPELQSFLKGLGARVPGLITGPLWVPTEASALRLHLPSGDLGPVVHSLGSVLTASPLL